MSCIELSPVVCVFSGLIFGASFGAQHGIMWAIAGAILGSVGGLLFYFVVIFCFAVILWLADRAQGGNTSLFPPKTKPDNKS